MSSDSYSHSQTLFDKIQAMVQYQEHLEAKLKANETHVKEGGMLDAILLECLSTGGAVDPKDYVYSALGFIAPEEADFIGCDYSLSCSEIYSLATVASIQYQGTFDILDLLTNSPLTENLPSWAVDFAKPETYSYRGWNEPVRLRYCMGTCQLLRKDMYKLSCNVSIDRSRGALSIRGSSVDRIIRVVKLDALGLGTPIAAEMTSQEAREVDCMREAKRCLRNVFDLRPWQEEHSKLAALATRMGLIGDSVANRPEGTLQDPPEKLHFDMNKHISPLRAATHLFELWTYLAESTDRISAIKFRRTNGDLRCSYWDLNGHMTPITGDRYGKDRYRKPYLFMTSSGLIGLAPATVLLGDEVVLLRSHNPFVALREKGQEHTFPGQLYVHGFWDEKLFEAWQTLDFEDETFHLV